MNNFVYLFISEYEIFFMRFEFFSYLVTFRYKLFLLRLLLLIMNRQSRLPRLEDGIERVALNKYPRYFISETG